MDNKSNKQSAILRIKDKLTKGIQSPYNCWITTTFDLPNDLFYPAVFVTNNRSDFQEVTSYVTDCDSLGLKDFPDDSRRQFINPMTGNFVCEIRRDLKSGKFFPVQVWLKEKTDWDSAVEKILERIDRRNMLENWDSVRETRKAYV